MDSFGQGNKYAQIANFKRQKTLSRDTVLENQAVLNIDCHLVDLSKVSPSLRKVVLKYGQFKREANDELCLSEEESSDDGKSQLEAAKSHYFVWSHDVKDFQLKHNIVKSLALVKVENQYTYCGYMSRNTGMPEGPGYAIAKNGTKLIEGNFRDGLLHGRGRILHAAPPIDFMAYDYNTECIEGSFRAGVPHGICTL
jgi:hypothetical protein